MNTLPVDPGNNDVAVAALSEAGRDLRIINTPIGEVRIERGILSPTYTPVYFSRWVEIFGSEVEPELDVESYRIGHSLYMMLNNDPGNFVPMEVDDSDMDVVREARENVLVRLSWEENIPGMPEYFRTKLSALSEMINGQDWESIDERVKAYEEFKGITKYLRETDVDGLLPEALEYYKQRINVFDPSWNEFYSKYIKNK